MSMTRRSFYGRILAGISLIALPVSMTGCWLSGSVFSQIMSYVGIGLTAFQVVVGLLDPPLAAVMAGAITLVKAGFADLQLAVQDYNNAPAADKTTLKNKIAVVLANLRNEIQSFWANLNLPDPALASLIQGLLSIILSTLAGFAGQLPVPVGAKVRAASSKDITVTPQVRDKKQFEKDFNAVLTQAGKPPVKF